MVEIEVGFGTDLTGLIATFGLSSGASATISTVPQVSGTTANDFQTIVTYIIEAEDGLTTQDWTVDVSIVDVPLLSVVPATHDFGTTFVTECTTAQTFTIDNVGASTITLADGDIYIDGTDSDQFTLNDDLITYPVTISPSVTVDIEFCPTSDGVKTASLVVQDNLSRTLHSFPITGTALPLNSGGPDTFGYTWANDLDPPEFNGSAVPVIGKL